MTVEEFKKEISKIKGVSEAENDLKLIKKDCNYDVQSSEIYVRSYLNNLNLIKKINEKLNEGK